VKERIYAIGRRRSNRNTGENRGEAETNEGEKKAP